jgi:hypothetical protein
MNRDPRQLTVEEYKAALVELEPELEPEQRELLRVHYAKPDHKATLTELSHSLGWESYRRAEGNYRSLARRIAQVSGAQRPEPGWVWVGFLASFRQIQGQFEFTLWPEVAQALEELGWVQTDPLSDIQQFESQHRDLDATTRKQIVDSRLGQGWFRAELVAYWKACAVTGCALPDVLRASHIKPWRVSNNAERLDPFNGLLLVPNLDCLFDRGLITFADDGRMLVASVLGEEARKLLGISDDMRLNRIDPRHRDYLAFHRTSVFRLD